MTIVAAAALIAAVLSTIITALWNQTHWPAETKRVVSGVVALILGIAVAIGSNQIVGIPADWVDGTARYLLILGGVAATAQALFSQFKDILGKLESATTLAPADDGTRYADGETEPAPTEGTAGLDEAEPSASDTEA